MPAGRVCVWHMADWEGTGSTATDQAYGAQGKKQKMEQQIGMRKGIVVAFREGGANF